MDRVGDAFVWPFRDPQWPSKILIMGLILLIPIVGAINLLGWMLSALHNLRAGSERMPPPNFDHLGRGFRLFIVFLAYYLVLVGVAAVLYIPSVVLFVQEGRHESNPLLVALATALSLLTFSVLTLGSLLMTFLLPAIVLEFERGGIMRGLNVVEVMRHARKSLTNTLVAGLMLIAASVVGQLGAALCLVGIVFTIAYAFAMQAWIVHSYEVAEA